MNNQDKIDNIELFFYNEKERITFEEFNNNPDKYSKYFTDLCDVLYKKLFNIKYQYANYEKLVVKINLPGKFTYAIFKSNKYRNNYQFVLTVDNNNNNLWFVKLFNTFFSDRLFNRLKIPKDVKNIMCYISLQFS